MKREEALALARKFRHALGRLGYPIERMLLFGSSAAGTAKEASDIDIAVVCQPFLPTRMDEMGKFFVVSSAIDPRIEPVCLHPEDLHNKYSTLVQEIKRTSIPVE